MAASSKIAIPHTRSRRWLLWAACEFVLFSGLLLAIRFGILGQEFTVVHAARFVLLGAALAGISALSGWLGARLLWFLFTAGALAGMLAMAYYSIRDADGWEDLVGLLALLELTAAGLAVGVVAELIALAIRRRRR